MKPIFVVFAFVLMLNTSLFSQKLTELAEYNCILKPINYSTEGIETESLLLFVMHTDTEMPLHYCNVYLLNKNQPNIQLIGDTAAFTNVYQISISPKNNYLALYVVSEGHPWIEIYDLQKLIYQQHKELITMLNPYPSTFNLHDWLSDESLILESDMNLVAKNKQAELSENDMLTSSKYFIYDLKSQTYSEPNQKQLVEIKKKLSKKSIK